MAAASAVDAALDDVRDRFGSAAITRAVLLGRDQGLSVLLPCLFGSRTYTWGNADGIAAEGANVFRVEM